MVTKSNAKNLVVVQLSGGNDALNTIIPYGDELYYDNRPFVNVPQDKVLPIDNYIGFNPSMAPLKNLYENGNVAIINGIGYAEPNRSHFRAMDIWHTGETKSVGTEGWLGRAIRELDPRGENVLTGVNFGRGLPRALFAKDVPVASVGDLNTYGLFPDIEDDESRNIALNAFSQMYGGIGKDTIANFFSQTGMDAMKGADILRRAPKMYSSTVEYANTDISQSLKSIAQVMFADIGTRVFYAQHGSFDTHSGEIASHQKLWSELSIGLSDFMSDLKEHEKDKDTIIFLFSEFGRRIKDNGAGTDHGSGGVAFVIGGDVKGGLYGRYPSLNEKDQVEGDLAFNNDFRTTYSTIAEKWLGVDPESVSNGNFGMINFLN
ncbi:MAG: hypothetical protein CL781_07280 [Chloroflexi bacterium]|nr:hypothetical protein [Chloroflexota bacterium]|tara:strand:- start:129 stop:1256 length:1128 start_codon:yes stop_codon:yes gene_type:complete